MDSSARYRSVDCLTIIEQRLPALHGASRRVAEAIVRDPWSILGMTIYDVAAAAGVSLPSVTRFCRAVGYTGFRELVQGIAQSLGRLEAKDIEATEHPGDALHPIPDVVAAVVRQQIEALQITARTIDLAVIEAATKLIANAQRVFILGHGAAYVPALGMAVKLNWAGVCAVATSPDMFTNQVVALGKGDVVVGLSHQGRTRDTIDMLALARDLGATTVGVSTVPQSPLAAVSDLSIAVLTPEAARSGTFLIAFDTLMVIADVIAALVSEAKWAGSPPNR
ncbi:MAG: MurR/RpiR family transcriptional regulator, partial [Thermomicrobiales bacterium]|nr:MurR/RpiR family transcriptional regulator [Thermomicrobiales bacterium]